MRKYFKFEPSNDFWELLNSKDMYNTQRNFNYLLFEYNDSVYRFVYNIDIAEKFNQVNDIINPFSLDDMPYKICLVDIYNPDVEEYVYFTDFFGLLQEGIIKIITDNSISFKVINRLYNLELLYTDMSFDFDELPTNIDLLATKVRKIDYEKLDNFIVGYCKKPSTEVEKWVTGSKYNKKYFIPQHILISNYLKQK